LRWPASRWTTTHADQRAFLFRDKGSPAEYAGSMKLALECGWLAMHESGTFVRFTSAGAELFA